ncbi:hypothetical protein TNCV_2142141 [Trichonephila clavipes]|uniref:Uncharacterized protein n=1 Tax=Trichonephila clavipes TaxID=2585209 RepID=A0A8X6S0Q4_TRICX|nr:hypothetical protein TNCV_2142141 [Trichonephila clavipes]
MRFALQCHHIPRTIGNRCCWLQDINNKLPVEAVQIENADLSEEISRSHVRQNLSFVTEKKETKDEKDSHCSQSFDVLSHPL